jgi:hypothetical protein
MCSLFIYTCVLKGLRRAGHGLRALGPLGCDLKWKHILSHMCTKRLMKKQAIFYYTCVAKD